MQIPELLLPAGDLEKAYFAFRYGADAIYMGVPAFSLRTRMNVVKECDIEEMVKFAHLNKKKVYITLNAFPHQGMMKSLEKHLNFLSKVSPDGLIIADTGVLYLANKICPKIPKHLSVQASTVSESGMRFWYESGVRRIILAREIPVKEVKKINQLFPEMELEYFVHGAVCMAYSGRCLLSNFMAYRDSNRGMCAHSCRWNYRVYDDEGRQLAVYNNDKKDVLTQGFCDGKDRNDIKSVVSKSVNGESLSIHDLEKSQVWEEEERKGDFIPVEEDFHGTHIMSSRDMCMIEYLNELVDAGVMSIKIEGRNKTIYYLVSVARAYSKALDDLKKGNDFDSSLWAEIHATANRGFFAGFLHGKPYMQGQQYEANRSISTHEFCGKVLRVFKKGDILDEDVEGFNSGYCFSENMLLINVKNRIDKGNKLIFIYPEISDDKSFEVQKLWKKGKEVDVIHGGDGNAFIFTPDGVEIENEVLIRQDVRNLGLM